MNPSPSGTGEEEGKRANQVEVIKQNTNLGAEGAGLWCLQALLPHGRARFSPIVLATPFHWKTLEGWALLAGEEEQGLREVRGSW